jgi:DNA primase
MAKIAQVSAKYIIKAKIKVDGIVDRPDVIGAIFGQTEGLLGADLELRELQKSGRIGRIEVHLDNNGGNTTGTIEIPSSMDKAETSIIGASIEVIDRIGPCSAKVKVNKIEDVRVKKRDHVVKRAKSLLQNLIDNSMPDSQEMSDEVAQSVRMMEIRKYGKDKLPCGPHIEDSEEILVVEGRADVLQLLKHGFKNAIAMNGTDVPDSIKHLSKQKIVTAFVDGDRGGDLIVKSLLGSANIDQVTTAPDGKEVEELTKKEIHKALRSKITAEQAEADLKKKGGKANKESRSGGKNKKSNGKNKSSSNSGSGSPKQASDKEKDEYASISDDIMGSRAACILDDNLDVLGKVPVPELDSTLKSLGDEGAAYAIVLDGDITGKTVSVAKRANISHVVGTKKKASSDSVVLYEADKL